MDFNKLYLLLVHIAAAIFLGLISNPEISAQHSIFNFPGLRKINSLKSDKLLEKSADSLKSSYYPDPSPYFIPQTEECYKFSNRLAAFLQSQVLSSVAGPFSGLVKLQAGLDFDESASLGNYYEDILDRQDKADIYLHGYLRILFQFGNDSRISEVYRHRIENTLKNFKYWPDDLMDHDVFGVDNMVMYTESHYISFASAGYLAAQNMPGTIFSASGHDGLERKEKFRRRINKWMELRFKTGFSEFLSSQSYSQSLLALLNIVDFSDDEDMRVRAAMICDILLFEIAEGQQSGVFRTVKGRTTFKNTADSSHDPASSIAYLITSQGRFQEGDAAAIFLATSQSYKIPSVICEVGTDTVRNSVASELHSSTSLALLVNEYGLNLESPEDGLLLWTYGLFSHPDTMGLTVKMLDAFKWWDHPEFISFKTNQKIIGSLLSYGELGNFVTHYEWDLTRKILSDANVYTYKTPDYTLSTVQDYRHGKGGDQHLVWLAALSDTAVVYTTHPGATNNNYFGSDAETPNYWTGSGVLPRAVQKENVVFISYNVQMRTSSLLLDDVMNFTHAYFPQSEFDEVAESEGWVFGRKGDGYIALWSQNGYQWQTTGMYKDQELIAPGTTNVWVCEMGRKKDHSSFLNFIEQVSQSYILAGRFTDRSVIPFISKELLEVEGFSAPDVDDFSVLYQSSSQGLIGLSSESNKIHRLTEFDNDRSYFGGIASVLSGCVLVAAVTAVYGSAVTIIAPAIVIGIGIGSAVYNLIAGAPGTRPVLETSYIAANYGRYNNPYTYSPYPSPELTIESKYHWLYLNYDSGHRFVNEFLDNDPNKNALPKRYDDDHTRWVVTKGGK